MKLTDFHASFIAHELTRRCPSDNAEKLTAVLADAQVDLNPHQIEAALFGLDNPLSQGVILADEVGLGKTIEAALLIAQTWAERKRRVLVILPANLRKQWRQELADKFFLPSVILDRKSFTAATRAGNLNPFDSQSIVICSYDFAAKMEAYIQQVDWNLVVIDEAHRLRNVYLKKNKVANAIKRATARFRKVLLTATPLQNSLLELYGLTSVVDDQVFGDFKAFKKRYGYIRADNAEKLAELKDRLSPFCKRTLRRQVIQYIRFTNRYAIRQEFTPSDAEHELYALVSEYLRRPFLYALPKAQRQLMTLMLRKQLASSTYAISGTLKKFADRLESLLQGQAALQRQHQLQQQEPLRQEHQESTTSSAAIDDLSDDADDVDDVTEGWSARIETGEGTSGESDDEERQALRTRNRRSSAEDEDSTDADTVDDSADSEETAPWDVADPDEANSEDRPLTPAEIEEVRAERDLLLQYHELAKSIEENSKGHVLLAALKQGFSAASDKQREAAHRDSAQPAIQKKAIIFTESRRTQDYLRRLLDTDEAGYKGRVVLFNGTNSDPSAKAVYTAWLKKHAGTDHITGSPDADMRAALVEHFRDHATIMIATEAAAEGINLQFCNLIINYDMPWNPQRIEQRIGRCHRYGQKCDVVVVNFVNQRNAADQRVYQLLDEKLQLFTGVFGASDEVLGSLETGVDFEKRIARIYQECRTPAEIDAAFNELDQEVEQQRTAKKAEARSKLLDNFDAEVIEKVRVGTTESVNRFQDQLWALARHRLAGKAIFNDDTYEFTLTDNPFSEDEIHAGPYRMGKNVEDANTFRVGHPLAQRILDEDRQLRPKPAEVTFDYSNSAKNIAILDSLVGRSGWLTCYQLTLASLDTEDSLILGGMADDGERLTLEQCRRLFDLSGECGAPIAVPAGTADRLATAANEDEQSLLASLEKRNSKWFQRELDKLEGWLSDREVSLRAELEKLEEQIADVRNKVKSAPTLPAKMALQKTQRGLEAKRKDAKDVFDTAMDSAEAEKTSREEEIMNRLTHTATRMPLFQLRWNVV